ncbi:MAG: sigma-70 family RNA polymerase sigma factor [Isosphaeraceae bacterium]
MMDQEDWDDLIAKLNRGDPEAIDRVLREYEPYLRMAVRRRLEGPLRTKFDSMDLVQSVWADVLSGLRKAQWNFEDRTQVRAFLLRVALNRLIDRRRRHRKALDKERPLAQVSLPPSTRPRPSEYAQEKELWDNLFTACSPRHREILLLRRQGLSATEIGDRLGLHEGSVRRILYGLARQLAERSGAEDSAQGKVPATGPAAQEPAADLDSD